MLMFCLIVSDTLRAQLTSATLSGTITDASEQPFPTPKSPSRM
jgi:hypothetical protein